MADLAIETIELVVAGDQLDLPCAEDIVGPYIRINSDGYWVNGNGTSSGEVGAGVNYIGIKQAKAGQTITGYGNGSILAAYTSADANALAGMAIGADVFVSDTDATLATTAGTVSTVVCQIIPGHGHPTTLDKLMRVDIPG